MTPAPGEALTKTAWVYCRRVAKHWVSLVAGTATALLGVVASATDLVVPPPVWWVVAIVLLGVAQFRAYTEVHRELSKEQRDKAAAADRLHRLQHADLVEYEDFRLWELLADPDAALVASRTFRHCTIRGPGLLALGGEGMIAHCGIGTPAGGIDSMLYALGGPNPRMGITAFVHCGFDHCKFEGVGFIGPEVTLQQLRGAFRT